MGQDAVMEDVESVACASCAALVEPLTALVVGAVALMLYAYLGQ